MTMSLRRTLRVLAVLAALVFLVLAAAWARLELRILNAGSPPRAEVFVLPVPAASRLLAAGYTEAVADFLWTRTLVYHGEHFTKHLDPTYLHAYMDALINLDPYFRSAYAWGGYAIVFAHYSGIPQPEDLLYTANLLRQGLRRFPDDAELHGILGYDLFYELPQWIKDPDLVARSKIEGAEHLRLEAVLGGGPPWLVLSAATALEQVNLDDLAARHLEESVQTVDDPDLRRLILQRLARLRANIDTESIRLAIDALVGTAAERFPYLSPGVYLLLSSSEAQAHLAVGLRAPPFVEP
jgi:hypothetical protein